ncbi:Protein Star [Dufourea novaeangliae]|uniref:Protein Star n=2 Tax=Dufourea novaeangliae TaxID=178035 RepID=A0A154P8Z8_DUFNO|nr:Protein Star [Dufourea novaeangliae]
MGQAKVIREILKDKKNGFFVECGAYDGETRSNTLVLERILGWTGLLVEADPINFSKMSLKNRKAYLTPTCLAVQPYPSVSSFLMADNVGRLHEANATDINLPNSADVAHSGTHVQVQCFPFIHYMTALNITTVNYFSLDVEGSELQILKTIPFDKISIETLSVEFSHVEDGRKQLIDFMEKNGYYVYSSVVRSDKLAHDIIFSKYSLETPASIE